MKTIAIASTTGGAGRTMLAATLALLLARRGRPVVALDFDPQNMLGSWLGLDAFSRHGIADELTRSPLDDDLWQACTWRNEEGVLFVPYGQSTLAALTQSEVRLAATSDWLADAIAQIDLPADGVVLIDTPRYPSQQAAQAIRAADLVLCATPPEPGACATLVTHFEALRRAAAQLKIVVNRMNPARDMQRDALAMLGAATGETLLAAQRVHLDAAMPESLARGSWFFDDAPHSQAAHDLQGLANWLDKWLVDGIGQGSAR